MRFALHALVAATILAVPASLMPTSTASASPGHTGGHFPVGVPAPRGTGRVVMIQMTDHAYNLKSLTVKAGETIRFVFTNKGSFLHEFNLGTTAGHAAHRPEMAMMADHGMITLYKVVNLTMTMPDGTKMTHTDPNSMLVEPGKTAEISWKFTNAGEFEIACNLPGHSESGMVMPLKVTGR